MCLVIIAKSGVSKNSDFLIEAIRKGAISNTDGIGYTFKKMNKNGQVWISKGFKQVEEFINTLRSKRLKDQDELIIHLRIGNKGATNTAMNHPFVLSNTEEIILSNNKFVEAPTMVHNGTFTEFSTYNSQFSDTYNFVQRFMFIPEMQSLLIRDKTQ